MEWYHNLLTYVSPLINVPILKSVYILNDLVCLAIPKLLNTIMMMKEVVWIFEQVQEYGGVKPVNGIPNLNISFRIYIFSLLFL